ncbi:MAG: MFS transporter [Rickettsiaceae bacterium]|nr:MFS transporter [Rickettsiaceae bacterium]
MILVYLINFLLAVVTTIGMALIPDIATSSMGMSLLLFGMIEGGSEFASMIFRFVSGNLFDHMKNKRMLFVVPAFFSFAAKIFLLFPSFITVFSSKILERMSNGLFASPRDAFIGQNAKNKGIAFAILNCSKTLGCVLGPLTVSFYVSKMGTFEKHPENIYTMVIIACVMCAIAVFASFFVDTSRTQFNIKTEALSFDDIKKSTKAIYPILILAFIFFLGRFNDGMIMVYLKKEGFSPEIYFSTIAIFNAIMFIVSPLIGYMIDKGKEKYMVIVTIASLLAFDVLFYNIDFLPLPFCFLGLVAWGIQRAGAQITFATMIFKKAPKNLYGTSIGLFSFVSGIGTLAASGICGNIADNVFEDIFIFTGAASLISFIVALVLVRRKMI